MRSLARAVALLAASTSWAQVHTGSIRGRVIDPSGAAVQGATVEIPGRRAVSSAGGTFALAGVTPGSHLVKVSAPGFLPAVLEAIVRTGEVADIETSLTVGNPHAITIVVESTPPPGTLGSVLDPALIDKLPLNRRDFLQLALLTPGVAPPVEDSELSSRGSFAMHALGGREEFNNFLIDGVDNNDYYVGTFSLQLPVDAIEEFQISTGGSTAEFGKGAGGQVNVVTRRGGDAWHGTLYEYFRNRALDARNFFEGPEKAKLSRNQFGGSLGGPLRKNKLFGFVNADNLRERRGLVRLATVPSAAERAGQFETTIRDPFTQQPFAGNRIPANRIPVQSLRVLDLFPLANNGTGAGNYRAQSTQRESLAQVHSRADWVVSPRDQVMGRYSFANQDLFEPYTEELTGIPGFGGFTLNRAHNATVQHLRLFGPAVVQSLRFGFNRTKRSARPQNGDVDAAATIGLPWLTVSERDRGYPFFNVSGLTPIGDATQLPLARSTDGYQVVEALTWLRGRHEFKFGGEWRHLAVDGFLDYFARGQLSFSGLVSGTGTSDLLLGFPSFALRGTFDNRQSLRSSTLAAFAEDAIRVTPRLTLQAGVRWEYVQPPVDPEDRMAAYDPATQSVVQVGTGNVPRAGISPDRNNIAPRIGFAWRANDDWTVRGGYGIFFDSGMFTVNSAFYFNPPYFNTQIAFPTAQGLPTLANPFGGSFPLPPTINTIDPGLVSGYSQQWNFAVERRGLRVAYAGSKGTHLIRSRDLNQPAPGPGNLATRRPDPRYSGIFFSDSGASSNYHSFQASYDKRRGRFGVQASYTWSKSIDDTSAFLGNKADKNFPQNSRDYGAERAVSSFDTPHRAVAGVTAVLPWKLEGRAVTVLQSGQPFTPIVRFDNSNTGNSGGVFGNDRPDVIGDPRLGTRTAEQWFNTAAFRVAAANTFGSAGRNVVRGPGFNNLDLALSRAFSITEQLRVEADAQAFNVFNNAHFNLPDRFAGEASFGRILSAKAPRQWQLMLRLRF